MESRKLFFQWEEAKAEVIFRNITKSQSIILTFNMEFVLFRGFVYY